VLLFFIRMFGLFHSDEMIFILSRQIKDLEIFLFHVLRHFWLCEGWEAWKHVARHCFYYNKNWLHILKRGYYICKCVKGKLHK